MPEPKSPVKNCGYEITIRKISKPPSRSRFMRWLGINDYIEESIIYLQFKDDLDVVSVISAINPLPTQVEDTKKDKK